MNVPFSTSTSHCDDGTNGDIISANGIYTLRTMADIVVLPDIEPEIIEIDMPQSFQLHQTDTVFMEIIVQISGKKFRISSSLEKSMSTLPCRRSKKPFLCLSTQKESDKVRDTFLL